MKKAGIIIVAVALLLITGIQAIQVIENKTISGKSVSGSATKEKITGESVTGEATTTSFHLNISVGSVNNSISILQPENITYNFEVYQQFLLNLSTTSNFGVDTWWFSLYDLNHSDTVYENVTFVPPTTFTARKWENRLIAYANNSTGGLINDTIEFYIKINNTAPLISSKTNIFACENSYFSHFFNVTDLNEYIESTTLNINNIFYLSNYTPEPGDYEYSYKVNYTTWAHEIYSDLLNKSNVGGPNNSSYTYTRTIFSYDGEYLSTKTIYITVIEINNPPNVTNPGVQTVYTQGENSTFYHELLANDVEDGNITSGNLTINMSFEGEQLFNISSYGIINFTANSSQSGVHNISICVTDNGLQNPHENASFCNETGINSSTCINFSLTITSDNRPPNITSYWPLNLNFNAVGRVPFYMNVTAEDPDGTIPDIYWYVDNQQTRYEPSSSFGQFYYSFPCGVSGRHVIKVRATDGSADSLMEWNVTVQNVSCEQTTSGGGGVVDKTVCIPKWACGDWGLCRSVKEELEKGLISGEEYRFAKELCEAGGLDENSCGIQERICRDLNRCDALEKIEIRRCLKTDRANCYDKIKNCHSGSCELLVDCGGPCDPCPTCNDGIQNQGEKGVDCEGPCPVECKPEKPSLPQPKYRYSLLLLIILLILYILNKTFRIIEKKTDAQKKIIMSVFLITTLILCMVFLYFYSSYRIGEFVYKKDGKIVGEIKNSSLTLTPLVQWQDGTRTKESVFGIGKVKDLEKEEIEKMLEYENAQEFSLYSWSPSGVASLKTPIRSIEELKNYTVNLNEDCNPSFICGPWSVCEVDYNLYSASESSTYGTKYRYCKDYSGCMANFVYAERCGVRSDVLITEEITPDEESVEIYNMNNEMVAKVTRRIEMGIKKLYIEIR